MLISYKLLTLLASGAIGQLTYQRYKKTSKQTGKSASVTPRSKKTVQKIPSPPNEHEKITPQSIEICDLNSNAPDKSGDDPKWLKSLHGVHGKAESNKRLALAGSGFALSALGMLGYAQAGLLALPLIGASTAAIVTDAIRLIRRRERVSVALIDLSGTAIIITTNHFTLIAMTQFLYHLSRRLLMMTESNLRSHFETVYSSRPQTVRRLINGVEREVPYTEIERNDVIALSAGQVVPVDGKVCGGSALIDQRMLTGESQPVEKQMGDEVLASTIVIEGYLELQVEHTGLDTMADKIEQYLHTTDEYKEAVLARGEKVVDAGAKPTLAISAATLLFVGSQQALAVNYAAFGYHMRIGAPLTILNYLDVASSSGVLIKDGRSLELLSKVDTFVFDKTGTLTEESPGVGDIFVMPGYDADELLQLTASAENGQSHPIASAILAEAKSRNLDLLPIESASCSLGFGLSVCINKQQITIGSHRLMAREGFEVPESLKPVSASAQNASFIYIAIDGAVQGCMELVHQQRPEAQSIITELQARGIEVIILSGDHEPPTQELAEKLGINRYYANVLPHGKADIIDQLHAEGRSLCFIGDGINDAIALKKADVSVSISGASTVALDTAAVVLMDGNLLQLIPLLNLSYEMKTNLDRSTVLSVLPGLWCVGGVLLGGMGITGALLSYNASILMVVGHSMLPWIKNQKGKKALPPPGK